ncbi:MAG: hypothetical protein Q7R49_03040 [Candidatus Daviesbacteria bacterium]|nr:hypothetical protein [Candidatus Daviesbacteria bacterium]
MTESSVVTGLQESNQNTQTTVGHLSHPFIDRIVPVVFAVGLAFTAYGALQIVVNGVTREIQARNQVSADAGAAADIAAAAKPSKANLVFPETYIDISVPGLPGEMRQIDYINLARAITTENGYFENNLAQVDYTADEYLPASEPTIATYCANKDQDPTKVQGSAVRDMPFPDKKITGYSTQRAGIPAGRPFEVYRRWVVANKTGQRYQMGLIGPWNVTLVDPSLVEPNNPRLVDNRLLVSPGWVVLSENDKPVAYPCAVEDMKWTWGMTYPAPVSVPDPTRK